MANEEHVALLKQGREVWNAWRVKPEGSKPNLADADLVNADLGGAILANAKLAGAILRRANLTGADLRGAILRRADLGGADLADAILRGAILTGADLRRADLADAILRGADLANANLSTVFLYETVFGNTNLTGAKGLETCRHGGPSTIDHRTLQRSGPLPLAFLRGVGLPDNLIDYLPSLLNQPIQFYCCFISYSQGPGFRRAALRRPAGQGRALLVRAARYAYR